ncbi:NAD-dependent succinate-semialdehyde dehydrogenase [Variovorax sp. KK3]|uniref:NAD-dependent succinate-semialdehyde dehydrogenase n=1 Tax=Variovorax sp. KK3 TaxID=1855728 RepID=UPI00097C6A0F|nr:NAD-dependent succinate-semialdehyde dehydrogenase [Variovorax sp. KK3]
MNTNANGADAALSIAGEWIPASARETLPLVDPATLETIGRVPVATRQDLDRALEAAAAAAPAWRRTSAYERSAILRRAAQAIREDVDTIARSLTREQGKTLAEARGEVLGAADTFDWFAEEGRRAYGRVIPPRASGERWLVVREPVGPVAAFSPWNFPAMLSSRKIAASLAAGCPCIIKPAEETPTPAIAFARALEQAGLPSGVLQIVLGVPGDISSHLIASPVIQKLSFTGSTAVGRHLARLAGEHLKKSTFELGGHAPVVVFDDADLARTVDLLVAGKVRNAGQVCIAPTRMYVQKGIYREFVDRLGGALGAVRVGNGLDAANRMGAMANARRIDAMQGLVEDARAHGATLVQGGMRAAEGGHFWQPTLLSDVPADARVMHEEPFGPLALVNPFDDLEDAAREANGLPYGLAAYAFTTSMKRSIAIGEAFETGVVGINNLNVSIAEAPFGGVKDSGWGSEAGQEGLEAYLHTKFISEV